MLAGLKAALAGALASVACCTFAASQPRVTITSPAPEQVLGGPDVPVHFTVSGAHLRPGGTNIHFMLDNEQFEVQYDESHPHVFKDVAPGTHTIRAYIANTMHEAIRGSLGMVTFSVAYPDSANRQCPGVPTLTYNLPQGEYLGIDAGDVAVDSLISNVGVAPGGNKVVYYVDGRRFFAEPGMPAHLKGLSSGYHVVRIELQDEYGDLIDGPFNSVERTILLSPGKSTNSPGVLASKYPAALPRVTSIRGAMTMGRPWVAVEKPRPMTKEQVKQSQKLTVRHGGAEAAAGIEAGTTPEGKVTLSQQSVTEAPEVTTEQSRSVVTTTGQSAPAEAEQSTTLRTQQTQRLETTPERRAAARPDALSSSTRLTSSGRKLDNRLDRPTGAPESTTLRAEAPTTGGRSIVHRVPVSVSTTASGTLRMPTADVGTSAPVGPSGALGTTKTAVAGTPSPRPVPSPTASPTPPRPTPVYKPGEQTPMPTYAPGQTSPTPSEPSESEMTSGTKG